MIIRLFLVLLFATGTAYAAGAGVPNPFSGMGGDSDKPITIQADSTVADIKGDAATYKGNVHVVQGNLHLRSDRLHILAQKGTISRIEADGNVVVASAQGQATGANAVYDVSKRLVTLTGKVVLTNGQNVMRGTRLVVNLASGQANLTSNGRVEGLFVPAKAPKAPALTNAQQPSSKP
ncbi:MAG: lipopolysaccharide transport periplasmic protein LptA [Alphaproteobacteria bacterium]|nr:lipopolysaccharide transport periplasmic protein LptA [Alphaproteobacteria bacterium]